MTDKEIKQQIRELLDEHAELYARSTARFIEGKIGDDRKEELWDNQDKKALDSLLAIVNQAVVGELKDLVMKGQSTPLIQERINNLTNRSNKDE